MIDLFYLLRASTVGWIMAVFVFKVLDSTQVANLSVKSEN